MKIIRSIVFVFATFWITTPVLPVEPLDRHKITLSDTDGFDLSEKSGESNIEDNEENTSALKTSTAHNPGSFVTSDSSAESSESSGNNSLWTKPVLQTPLTLNTLDIQELSHILEPSTTSSQDSVTSSNTPKAPQATEQLTMEKTLVTSAGNITLNASSTEDILTNATSSPASTPPHDVLFSFNGTKTYIDKIFKQSLSWLGDTYSLSIIVPILAGFVFAAVIIVTVTTFACIRRRCRRRRLRRKFLPDGIRKMGPSDRARLLAETSDEEF